MLVFRHELAREAMLSTISPDRLIELHTDILATLESSTVSDQDPARLAHHAEGARHTEAVLRYAVAAAERARKFGAHRQAAAQYARALRFAEGLDAPKRAELLEASSTALYITDRWSEATEARENALAIWRAIGDVRREGDNLRWVSRLLWVAGRNRDAEQIGQEAIAVLETLPPGPELAMAYSNLSQLSMLAAEYADSIAWGEKAIALANTANDVQTLVHARINVGTSRLQSNDERGLDILDEALHLAITEKMGDHAGRAYANICSGSVEQRRFAIANNVLAEGIAFCREYDLDFYRWYMTAWQGVSNLYQGRWSDIDEALEAIALDSAKTPPVRIPAMFVIGSLFARRGDPRSASILETALELAAVTGEMQRIGPVRAARAEAAWLAGDTGRTILEARAEYDNALRLQNPWLSGEYAYWLWRAGDLTTPPVIAIEPYARQIRGDWSGAADLWDQLGCPYEAARARAESEDEVALRQAWSVFDALSARPDQNALTQRMRSLGIRNLPRGSRVSTRSNPANLTAREVDVLRNLALGRTNPEIGQALFLSPKTIEHHVSAILSKLGVSTRREALAVAGERGLLDQYRGAPA
jgi:DNA-binding CsgD family transcriptional regulator/tetratricopeptide (TPR) repeat protein